MGVAAGVLLATFLVPAQPAYAADGCGDGWFKQSDGYLTKDDPWSGYGSRNAWIYHSGRVRFCTDDDTFNNDENRRALIGYPSDSYPFMSEVRKNGSYAQFCVDQTIRVHMTGIHSSDSWSISGSVSKGDPGVSASYSSTYNTVTVTVGRNATCAPNADRITARTSGIMVTADNESGEVEWVQLTTKIRAVYWVNGNKHSDVHSLVEHDYSSRY
jgi:hypothetical protein